MNVTISFGKGHPARIEHVRTLAWSDFAAWLTKEPPEVKDKADRGWYIPATFNPVYRDGDNFQSRCAITLDFDHVNIDTWGEVLAQWRGRALAIYTTFSHRADRPRFRIVLPLSRPASYDEFQAVARRVASDIGIELVARESFVPAQMMYCPTRPLGGQFIAEVRDGSPVAVDAVLAQYKDWTDVTSWPRRKDGDSVHAIAAERVAPLDKPGIIGEFNRAYTISQAIEAFQLPYGRVR